MAGNSLRVVTCEQSSVSIGGTWHRGKECTTKLPWESQTGGWRGTGNIHCHAFSQGPFSWRVSLSTAYVDPAEQPQQLKETHTLNSGSEFVTQKTMFHELPDSTPDPRGFGLAHMSSSMPPWKEIVAGMLRVERIQEVLMSVIHSEYEPGPN